MSDHSFTTYIDLRTMPLGRAQVAIEGTAEEARALGNTALADFCDALVEEVKEALLVQMDYEAGRANNSKARGQASVVDQKADRTVANLYRGADNYASGFDADHPKGKAAREFTGAIFPAGVKVIIHQSYDEQLASMEAILTLCRNDYARHVQDLHLTDWVELLADQIVEYRQELALTQHGKVTYGELVAVRKHVHLRLCQLISRILGTYNELDEADEAKRKQLLTHIAYQQDAVYEMRRRQHRVTDIDPESGEEIGAQEADVDTPAPSPADAT